MKTPCTIAGKGVSYVCLERMKTIPLTQGYETIVDDEDYEDLSEYKWFAQVREHRIYAARNTRSEESGGSRTIIKMSRQIGRFQEDMVVDHKNGDALDNRRSNLRVCTFAENTRNRRKQSGSRSSYKGVSYRPRKREDSKRWRVQVWSRGKRYDIGYFYTEEEAARAYDKESKRLHGDFSRTNEDLGLFPSLHHQ